MKASPPRAPHERRRAQRGNLVLIVGLVVLALGAMAVLSMNLVRQNVENAAAARYSNFGETLAMNTAHSLINAVTYQVQASGMWPASQILTPANFNDVLTALPTPSFAAAQLTSYNVTGLSRAARDGNGDLAWDTISQTASLDFTVRIGNPTVAVTVTLTGPFPLTRAATATLAQDWNGPTQFWHVTQVVYP